MESWGRVPRASETSVVRHVWRDARIPDCGGASILPRGLGRSYGDSCLNDRGVLLDVTPLDRLISLDTSAGVLRCESGVSFHELVAFLVPRGFFLPVTPGTAHITVGGAIANDVHGKNHHVAGSFGAHVTRLELVRSSGERHECSPTEEPELFSATVGGLGLTGLITWAEVRLKRIEGPDIEFEEVRFGSVDDFHGLNVESERTWEYTVAWIDSLAKGSALGRGIYIRGRHAPARTAGALEAWKPARPLPAVPFDAPPFLLGHLTMRAFNEAWYRLKGRARGIRPGRMEPFFYPLDAVPAWNRLYGRRGFFQYQCVLPHEHGKEALRELLGRISASGQGSFLSVLKTFGDRLSPGMLSFPRPGITVALDFANLGESSLRLFDDLDSVVRQAGGALYPAKDARMPSSMFHLSYPRWREFARRIDPAFSSSFWRRVAAPLLSEAA